jgi:hypothetical protein
MEPPAMQFLHALAKAATSSVAAGPDVTSAFSMAKPCVRSVLLWSKEMWSIGKLGMFKPPLGVQWFLQVPTVDPE